jgi:hypothetical protein
MLDEASAELAKPPGATRKPPAASTRRSSAIADWRRWSNPRSACAPPGPDRRLGRRASPRPGRGGGLLRRRRGTHQRGSALRRRAGRGRDQARRRPPGGRVADDGSGGAGSGRLRPAGLADRVGALDGRLQVDDPAGGGDRSRPTSPRRRNGAG